MIFSLIKIEEDEIGIVTKKFDVFQTRLPVGKLIALNDEVGVQADIMSPGTHLYQSWLYTIETQKVIEVPQGEIALVVAKDGQEMPRNQLLGRKVQCNNFQDARAFLENGGQKGRQIEFLTEGRYQINTKLFDVITSKNARKYGVKSELLKVYTVAEGMIGIVTTQAGRALPKGEIAGGDIADHQNFQDGQNFLDNDGYKGLQEEYLSSGAYKINPWFAKIEQIPLVEVPTGTVGVVVSYVGKTLENKSEYQLVDKGYKGIWKEVLEPSHHPINLKVMSVEIVPTHEITLDWCSKEKAKSNYDANLQTLKLRSKDGHEFSVEVTQVISIHKQNAPKMISRVGSPENKNDTTHTIKKTEIKFSTIKNLVTRVLEPMIGNYFRNSAQDYNVLDFHEKRSERQLDAQEHITEALEVYGVQAKGTFINKIDPPDELEHILRQHTLAQTKRKTYIEQIETEKIKEELTTQIAFTERKKREVDFEFESWKLRELNKVDVENLRNVIDILGTTGYLHKAQIDAISKIKLPNFMGGDNSLLPLLFGATKIPANQLENDPEKLSMLAQQILSFLDNKEVLMRPTQDYHDDFPPPPQVTITNDDLS